MANAPPQYDLGILVGNRWKQWANAVGQDYYQDLQNPTYTQYEVPHGYEDSPQDTWSMDTSKTWQQWRNNRTGRIRLDNPYPPPPQTYLDLDTVKTHLQLVERTPESREYLYRRLMVAVLRYFFKEHERFEVFQEESMGETVDDESRVDTAVLKILSRPGGSTYAYDYCLIESKKAGKSWPATEDQLSRHCGGARVDSRKVYGIAHVGMEIQFFRGDHGVLTQMSDRLHLRRDVTHITTMFEYLKKYPLPLQ